MTSPRVDFPLFDETIGRYCHEFAQKLFPICRSITGQGVRDTLTCIQEQLPELAIRAVPSGTQAFDWTVPDEWNIHDGYILDTDGQRIVDFKKNNLHVLGYSVPVDRYLSLDELNQHLFSLPEQPHAIPYMTSYYAPRWGFCLPEAQRKNLKAGEYRAVIHSELKPGVLNYGELIIPGESEEEVFLSTYVCHPSMANNELSGPVVTVALALWLQSLPRRRYTYRIVFIPETIGSIVYLSQHAEHLKKSVIAGFNITCVGDERCYSFLSSRHGDTLSDRAAKHVLKYIDPNFKHYTWLDRGSDERQYCAPGIDLPIATIMRSKYGEYPEYHTSLDDLTLVTPYGLAGGFKAIQQALEVIENNVKLQTTVCCEPQLGKRGLYPTLSTKGSHDQVRMIINLISYCDGRTLLEISELIDEPVKHVLEVLQPLIKQGLIKAS